MIHITRPLNHDPWLLVELINCLRGEKLGLQANIDYFISKSLSDLAYSGSLKTLFIIGNKIDENNPTAFIVGSGCYQIYERYSSQAPIFFIQYNQRNGFIELHTITGVTPLPKEQSKYGFSHTIECVPLGPITPEKLESLIGVTANLKPTLKLNYLLMSSIKR